MLRRVVALSAVGAAVGAVAGLIVMAFIAGSVLEGSVGAVLLDPITDRARSQFVMTSGGAWSLVLATSAVGGAVLAGLTVGLGRIVKPDEHKFPAPAVALFGAVAGAIVGYIAFRIGFGVGGIGIINEAGDELLTLSVFRAIMIASIVGASVGLMVVPSSDVVSQPAVFGFSGAAWRDRPEFRKETVTAVGTGIAAVIAIAAVVFALSRALLAGQPTVAVVVAVSVALLILAGASYLASHPDDSPARTGIVIGGLVVVAIAASAIAFAIGGTADEHHDDEAEATGPTVSIMAAAGITDSLDSGAQSGP